MRKTRKRIGLDEKGLISSHGVVTIAETTVEVNSVFPIPEHEEENIY